MGEAETLSSISTANGIQSRWLNLSARTRIIILLCGWQVLSGLLACTSILTTCLVNDHFSAPLIQSFGNYLLLAVVFIPWRLHARGQPVGQPKEQELQQELQHQSLEWWKFALIALADVEGNYLVVLAYNDTDIASATLLDCFTIPCVVGLSMLLLRTKYNWRQAVGIMCCVLGLAALLICDLVSKRSSSDGGSHKLRGDLLVLLGSVCYAISNVSQELVVKSSSPIEFLSWIGGYGALISATQIAVLEREELSFLFNEASAQVWTYLICYVCALSTMYMGVPLLLCYSSATVMNLSFLTSDFWAVLAALFLFGDHLQWYYFVAFAVIMSGVLVYHANQSDQGPMENTKDVEYNHDLQHSVLAASMDDSEDMKIDCAHQEHVSGLLATHST